MSNPTIAQAAALKASGRYWDFRYELLDNTNGNIGALGTLYVTSCSVANNDLATQVKRTCTLSVPDVAYVEPLIHRLRPYARLRLPDGTFTEWCMGTFILSTDTTPRATTAGDRQRTFQGYDLLLVLVEDKVTDRYVVAAGTNYITAVTTVLTSSGFTTVALGTTTSTLPAAMEWEPGTPKLTIVNDLLTAINFTSLTMSPMGVPSSAPYTDPDNETAIWEYLLDRNSVVRPGIDTSLDLFDVPNVWVGIVSSPDRPALRSVVTNNVDGSRLSTTSRGRNVVRILTDEVKDAPDQATLDALVLRYSKEAFQLFEEATFTSALMPFHESGDVAILNYGAGPIRFREHSWDMELKAGGNHKHVFRRTVIV